MPCRGYYTSFNSKWVDLRVVCELLHNGLGTNLCTILLIMILDRKKDENVIISLSVLNFVDLVPQCDIPLRDVKCCCYIQALDAS